MHHEVSFELTPGLTEEIQHLEQEEGQIYDSIEDLIQKTENTNYNATISELHSRLPPKSSIIDVGCGFGETSLLLAQHGHQVYSIEPSSNRLTSLKRSANKMQLPIQTYLCSGESISQASLPKMDGCLFNSSLHHCDDPLKALKGVKKILKDNGVIVINEPILKFYLTKKRFYKLLKTNPIKMGHYGGNEHIYYYKEYYNLLKTAGFKDIQSFWCNKMHDPRKTLIRDLNSRFYGSYQHSFTRCVIKYAIHTAVKYASNSFLESILVSPLMRFSLLQAIFVARVQR